MSILIENGQQAEEEEDAKGVERHDEGMVVKSLKKKERSISTGTERFLEAKPLVFPLVFFFGFHSNTPNPESDPDPCDAMMIK